MGPSVCCFQRLLIGQAQGLVDDSAAQTTSRVPSATSFLGTKERLSTPRMGLRHSRVYQEVLLAAGDVIGLCKSSTQDLTLRGDSAGVMTSIVSIAFA